MTNLGKHKKREAALIRANTDYTMQADELPAPSRIFAANWGQVTREGQHLRLVFAHLIPDMGQLSAAVHITIGAVALVQSFGGGGFFETLSAYVHAAGLQDFTPPDPKPAPLERNAMERATHAFMAQTGEDSEVRFYMASPGSNYTIQQRLQAQQPVTLDQVRGVFQPVVTIQTDTRLLWYMLNRSAVLA